MAARKKPSRKRHLVFVPAVEQSFLDREEAAKWCQKIGVRIPSRTLRHWEQTGKGPRVTRIGRRVVYHIEDLAQWLNDQRLRGPKR